MAVQLGRVDVHDMIDSLTWDEFQEWIAYSQLEPFGEIRGDLRAGIVASVVANANRDPKKSRVPFKASDFMPDFEKGRQKAADRKPVEDVGTFRKILQMAKRIAGGRTHERRDG